MSMQDMDFERHPAPHFAVVIHQGLDKPYIVFGLAIPQKAPNHCFLRPSEIWGGGIPCVL